MHVVHPNEYFTVDNDLKSSSQRSHSGVPELPKMSHLFWCISCWRWILFSRTRFGPGERSSGRSWKISVIGNTHYFRYLQLSKGIRFSTIRHGLTPQDIIRIYLSKDVRREPCMSTNNSPPIFDNQKLPGEPSNYICDKFPQAGIAIKLIIFLVQWLWSPLKCAKG